MFLNLAESIGIFIKKGPQTGPFLNLQFILEL